MNAGTSEKAIRTTDNTQLITVTGFFLSPLDFFLMTSHTIPAISRRTAKTISAPKKRHFILTVGMRIIPRSKTTSAALMIARFFLHAAFSRNLVNVKTTSAISANVNKMKKIMPIINLPFGFVMGIV